MQEEEELTIDYDDDEDFSLFATPAFQGQGEDEQAYAEWEDSLAQDPAEGGDGKACQAEVWQDDGISGVELLEPEEPEGGQQQHQQEPLQQQAETPPPLGNGQPALAAPPQPSQWQPRSQPLRQQPCQLSQGQLATLAPQQNPRKSPQQQDAEQQEELHKAFRPQWKPRTAPSVLAHHIGQSWDDETFNGMKAPSRSVILKQLNPACLVYKDFCLAANWHGAIDLIRIIPQQNACVIRFVTGRQALSFFHSFQAMVALPPAMCPPGMPLAMGRDFLQLRERHPAIQAAWGKSTPLDPQLAELARSRLATRCVHVYGVPPTTTETQLRALFAGFGELEGVMFRPGQPRTLVFLTSLAAAVEAVRQLNQTAVLPGAPPLRLKFGCEGTVPQRITFPYSRSLAVAGVGLNLAEAGALCSAFGPLENLLPLPLTPGLPLGATRYRVDFIFMADSVSCFEAVRRGTSNVPGAGRRVLVEPLVPPPLPQPVLEAVLQEQARRVIAVEGLSEVCGTMPRGRLAKLPPHADAEVQRQRQEALRDTPADQPVPLSRSDQEAQLRLLVQAINQLCSQVGILELSRLVPKKPSVAAGTSEGSQLLAENSATVAAADGADSDKVLFIHFQMLSSAVPAIQLLRNFKWNGKPLPRVRYALDRAKPVVAATVPAAASASASCSGLTPDAPASESSHPSYSSSGQPRPQQFSSQSAAQSSSGGQGHHQNHRRNSGGLQASSTRQHKSAARPSRPQSAQAAASAEPSVPEAVRQARATKFAASPVPASAAVDPGILGKLVVTISTDGPAGQPRRVIVQPMAGQKRSFDPPHRQDEGAGEAQPKRVKQVVLRRP